MNGAASPGQQVWTGRRPRSTSSPVRTTSCTGPLRTLFGCESAIDFNFFRPRTFSARPCGGCISSTSPSRRPTSSSESAPKARHIRRSLPNWLISSGCWLSFGCSNSSAGPPALMTRSMISVTSRCGSTSAATRTSSPSRSRSEIHSRRSPGGTKASVSLGIQRQATGLPSRTVRPRCSTLPRTRWSPSVALSSARSCVRNRADPIAAAPLSRSRPSDALSSRTESARAVLAAAISCSSSGEGRAVSQLRR